MWKNVLNFDRSMFCEHLESYWLLFSSFRVDLLKVFLAREVDDIYEVFEAAFERREVFIECNRCSEIF
jgi:hypothetical protein